MFGLFIVYILIFYFYDIIFLIYLFIFDNLSSLVLSIDWLNDNFWLNENK